MEDEFFIPVNYKGAEREYPARLEVFGYSHRFRVVVEGTEVLFEKDEEGSYRAVIPPETQGKIPETGLLQSIAQAIIVILS
jgi:hypothetical protein